METIRAFIAVDIGDGIRGKLEELQRKLMKASSDVRWVKPRHIHLTLAFLGDLPTERIPLLKTRLDEALRGLEVFELEAAGTGYFGTSRHPRVIWGGIADCPPLMELQQRTIGALQAAEIQCDSKPFSPHFTLGRIRGGGHMDSLLDRLEKSGHEALGRTRIDAVQLIQSDLRPGGAEYSVLHHVPLSRTGCSA